MVEPISTGQPAYKQKLAHSDRDGLWGVHWQEEQSRSLEQEVRTPVGGRSNRGPPRPGGSGAGGAQEAKVRGRSPREEGQSAMDMAGPR